MRNSYFPGSKQLGYRISVVVGLGIGAGVCVNVNVSATVCVVNSHCPAFIL